MQNVNKLFQICNWHCTVNKLVFSTDHIWLISGGDVTLGELWVKSSKCFCWNMNDEQSNLSWKSETPSKDRERRDNSLIAVFGLFYCNSRTSQTAFTTLWRPMTNVSFTGSYFFSLLGQCCKFERRLCSDVMIGFCNCESMQFLCRHILYHAFLHGVMVLGRLYVCMRARDCFCCRKWIQLANASIGIQPNPILPVALFSHICNQSWLKWLSFRSHAGYS